MFSLLPISAMLFPRSFTFPHNFPLPCDSRVIPVGDSSLVRSPRRLIECSLLVACHCQPFCSLANKLRSFVLHQPIQRTTVFRRLSLKPTLVLPVSTYISHPQYCHPHRNAHLSMQPVSHLLLVVASVCCSLAALISLTAPHSTLIALLHT